VRVPYSEAIAMHTVLESCAVHREVYGEALTKVCTGQPLRRVSSIVQDADAVYVAEGNTSGCAMASIRRSCVVREPGMYRGRLRGNREISGLVFVAKQKVHIGKTASRKPMMHDLEKSDLHSVRRAARCSGGLKSLWRSDEERHIQRRG
jgi:hypothetical protein